MSTHHFSIWITNFLYIKHGPLVSKQISLQCSLSYLTRFPKSIVLLRLRATFFSSIASKTLILLHVVSHIIYHIYTQTQLSLCGFILLFFNPIAQKENFPSVNVLSGIEIPYLCKGIFYSIPLLFFSVTRGWWS